MDHALPKRTGCPACGLPIRTLPNGGPEHDACWELWRLRSDLEYLRTVYTRAHIIFDECAKLGLELRRYEQARPWEEIAEVVEARTKVGSLKSAVRQLLATVAA